MCLEAQASKDAVYLFLHRDFYSIESAGFCDVSHHVLGLSLVHLAMLWCDSCSAKEMCYHCDVKEKPKM